METAPQRFTRVAPLDRRAARDAFPVVAALHALAAELAVPRLTDARPRARCATPTSASPQALKADDVDAALAADDAFHGVFVDGVRERRDPARARAPDAAACAGWSGCASARSPGRASVKQHAEIIAAAAAEDVSRPPSSCARTGSRSGP